MFMPIDSLSVLCAQLTRDLLAIARPISSCFSMSGYRYLSNGGTDRSEILHDGRPTYRFRSDLLPLLGSVPEGSPESMIRNFGPNFLPCDRDYLENDNSQRYMSKRA